MNYIVSQIFGVIALILVAISYFRRKKLEFLVFQNIANIFYALSLITLNLLVAGIGTFISLIRTLIFYIYVKNSKDIPWYYLPLFFSIYAINGVINWQYALDVLVILSSITFTIAFYIKNLRISRYVCLLPNLILFIYNIIFKNYAAGILDLIEFFVILVAIIKFEIEIKQQNKEKINEKNNIKTEEDSKEEINNEL